MGRNQNDAPASVEVSGPGNVNLQVGSAIVPPPPKEEVTKPERRPLKEKEEHSYHKPLKDNPELQAKAGRWKTQKRVKCDQKRCAYPLNLIQSVENNRQLEVVEDEDGNRAYKAVCSWDPRHTREDGSAQYITHLQLHPPEDE